MHAFPLGDAVDNLVGDLEEGERVEGERVDGGRVDGKLVGCTTGWLVGTVGEFVLLLSLHSPRLGAFGPSKPINLLLVKEESKEGHCTPLTNRVILSA